METIPDIIRGFRAADGEVLRIAGAEAEPFAAVDPRHLRVEAAAGASARIVVLHTAPDVSSLTLTLAEGAQLELTELFTAEAFAEVSVKQAAHSRCRLTTVLLSSANASYRIDLDGADAENELGGVFLAAGEEHCVLKLRTTSPTAAATPTSRGSPEGRPWASSAEWSTWPPTPSAPTPGSRAATSC